MSKQHARLIALAGMPGAGKGIVSEVAKEMRYCVFMCGEVIRDEAKNRGITQTPVNLGELMLRLRQEEGPSVVAKRLVPRIAKTGSSRILVEGIRSLEELEELRKQFKYAITVAVHASPQTRFKRLTLRRREDDPRDRGQFSERDARELSVGLGNIIALSQVILINEGSINELRNESMKLLEKVEAHE